jgi:hypothetical protein
MTKPKPRDSAAAAGCLVGIAISCYVAALLGLQCVTWLQQGTWVKLPATYLFEPPPFPNTEAEFELEIQESFPDGATQEQRIHEIGRLKSRRAILTFVPSLAFLTPDWFAHPGSWLGLHKLVRGTLDELSVPFVFGAAALGITLLGLKIAEPAPRPDQLT